MKWRLGATPTSPVNKRYTIPMSIGQLIDVSISRSSHHIKLYVVHRAGRAYCATHTLDEYLAEKNAGRQVPVNQVTCTAHTCRLDAAGKGSESCRMEDDATWHCQRYRVPA